MAKIKNLLFDLGGVLLNIDYNKTADAFKKLGIIKFDELYSQADANDLFESLETGKVKEEDFYITLQQYCHPGTSKEQIETAWNSMLGSFRTESLNWLKVIKGKYNIFLLSNTNSIHLTALNKIFKEEVNQSSIDDYFKKAWYSHDIQMRKPYPSTYRFVLNDVGLKAEETLFVDDSIKNIEGAKEAGLQIHHLLPGDKIEEMLL